MNNCPFLIQPLTQVQQSRNKTLANFSYTNQDFNSMKTALANYIQTNFSSIFNDQTESDLGWMLLENFCFLGDMLSFKQDQIANEVFIDTVTQISNAFRIAQLVGYRPTPVVSSLAQVSLTINTVQVSDLSISPPIQLDIIQNGVTIAFEVYQGDQNFNPLWNEPMTIVAGELTNSSCIAIQGSTIVDVFRGTSLPGQVYSLSLSPVSFGTVRLSVDGMGWTQVTAFTSGKPNLEYILTYTSSYGAYVTFGTNNGGAIPQTGSTIKITYISNSVGASGNVNVGAINTQRNYPVSGFLYALPVTILNYGAAQFGYNGDTADDIRQKLPLYVNQQSRLVSGFDIKSYCDSYVTPFNGAIGKSTVVLRSVGCSANIVNLFVLGNDGNNNLIIANDALKSDLYASLSNLTMMNLNICIMDGDILYVNVVIDCTLDAFYQPQQTQIATNIQNQVNNFFALSNWDYGQTLRNTDMIKFLSTVNQVSSFYVQFTTTDPLNSGSTVLASYFQIIRPLAISISFNFN